MAGNCFSSDEETGGLKFSQILNDHLYRLATKNTNIFFIPIHSQNHFALLIVDLGTDNAFFFDSLLQYDSKLMQDVKAALNSFSGSLDFPVERICLSDIQEEEWECGHLVNRKMFLFYIFLISAGFNIDSTWMSNIVEAVEKDVFTGPDLRQKINSFFQRTFKPVNTNDEIFLQTNF